ncbi:response regulator receiver protein [Caballeronia concitans]|uniref:Response regulator receiver protein n=2 Tax=Caballeronia concitans TaxID=1777133 RepID=A0A658QVU6_9BURK|nr:response regulator receiver protein [Burkholderia sp. MR1]SAL27222.1 response regulator receiver protein [Caballeronia concitans]
MRPGAMPRRHLQHPPGSMVTETSSSESLAVAERVRELMSRHGIGKRQQTAELCRILDLSFSQGHRKLRGNSPWTIAQIRRVADAFDEPALKLFDAIDTRPDDTEGIPHDAVLKLGSVEIPCTAWIGNSLDAGTRPDFIAQKLNARWVVTRHEGVLLQEGCDVHKIEILPRRTDTEKPIIAVVDDDHASADNLHDYLEMTGFTAMAFYGLDAFLDALQSQVFDAVVIDWLFGTHTSAGAIQAVRESDNPDAPVFVLTGELTTGKASESEISQIIRDYNVTCFEKPARLGILVADLSKRLLRA